MESERTGLDLRFDVRVVSLYSRSIQESIPRNIKDTCSFYSFCYYDAIQVSPVSIKAGPLLKTAYAQARRKDLSTSSKGCAFRQFLVAATDIVSSELDGSGYGYTADAIESFWKNIGKHPLFFVSMINLHSSNDLSAVWKDIRTSFKSKEHLVYTTFDHCDLILFSYGDTFQKYTDKIFSLYYGSKKGLDDVITLYSFSAKGDLTRSSEEFRALIRIGVRDYPTAIDFRNRVTKIPVPDQPTSVQINWLLGRNDISILYEKATLQWLASVRDTLIEIEKDHGVRWYTTYDLTVFSIDNTDQDSSIWRSGGGDRDFSALHRSIQAQFKKFRREYLKTFRDLERTAGLQLTPNNVWLRWLEESCALAAELMESRLSSDLATCLVPQFLDLLHYSTKLFSSKKISKRDDIDEINQSFIRFFSNMAILVDSMNQTNRQFVQVPSFHLPSFEIPPQILAYYTVLVQKLREVLQDDVDIVYSMTISPKLVNTLSVSSLALQNVLPCHQWISMSMDEDSFYTLQLTTETIAHEVSHYIGQRSRCRNTRKECVMKCAFQILFMHLLWALCEEVGVICSHLTDGGESKEVQLPQVDFNAAVQIAERLWKKAVTLCGISYDIEHMIYSGELEDLLEGLLQEIETHPPLVKSFFQEIWGLAKNDPDSFKNMMSSLQVIVCIKTGIRTEYRTEDKNFDSLMKAELNKIFETVLSDFQTQFENSPEDLAESEFIPCQQIGKLNYMFRETFADLQAIMLLNMTWENYCNLLLREYGKKLTEDCPLRMLAVSKVLAARDQKFLPEHTTAEFRDVLDSVGLSIEDKADTLAELGFEVTYLYYLTDYLTSCADAIAESFQNKEKLVKNLQELHKNLSDNVSLYDLQRELQPFIEDYQDELLIKN